MEPTPSTSASPSIVTPPSGAYSSLARLANGVVHALRSVGSMRLEPEPLLRLAHGMTGLDDRDLGAIVEPLTLLCDDLRASGPTDLGAAVVHTTLLQGLINRRRVQHALAGAQPRPLMPPIVLVGWYRTGTTYLQQLMSALPGYDFVPMYRLAEPVVGQGLASDSPWLLHQASDIWARARYQLGTAAWGMLVPELEATHPVSATGAEECWFLHLMHLQAEGLALHWDVPNYYAWLKRSDRHAVYRTWVHAAALLERELGHGLVLKDPAHMAAIPVIREVLPEARLVWTHRDPVKALASFGTLSAGNRQIVYGRYDTAEVGAMLLDRAGRFFDAGVAARAGIPQNRLADVADRALRRDPVGEVERICAQLELPFDRAAITARAAELAQRDSHQHVVTIDHWGLRPEQVYERLAAYPRTFWRDPGAAE